eukprot:CAMPEP_0119043108 /NCGR_PEP_ID=MMETSP1177-20130426/17647_1 /TAXON_ID=2985 /ORGANISM="Ochromonas sp, Strain CCMP1899" /LENGTH=989 /DNA_ID=CAMNT_0007010475 /DNA_START=132 /DNA_END=3098 /DNA_ORIENTATION=-
MLRQNGKKMIKAFNARHSVFTAQRLSFSVKKSWTLSNKKSWTPLASEDALLQKITTQALILDMNNHMNASSALTVPWFLKQMPMAYFNQISEERRKQHLQAVIAIRDLQQLNLSLKLESKGEEGSSEVTFINSQTKTGNLYSQIKNLSVPEGSNLARVRVYSALDNSLALNVFSFESSTKGKQVATLEDAEPILEYIKNLKAGQYDSDPRVPKYCDLFSDENIADYITRVSPSYVIEGGPRRFLIQRGLFEEVKGTDGTAVHIETYTGSTPAARNTPAASEEGTPVLTQGWITVAASNVLPEVLLRLSSSMISAGGYSINRANMESVSDHEHSSAEMPAVVTMLRLLVSPDPLGKGKEVADLLKKDLKRAKWLDDSTTDLGLIRFPWLGTEKAEIINAFCSMLHGPLAKIDSQAFISIKSIVDCIAVNSVCMHHAASIAELFMDRFNPNGSAISTQEFKKREADIRSHICMLSFDSPRTVLLKMLDGTAAALRTNFFNEDRYALSLRIDPSIMMPSPLDPLKPMPFGVFFVHGRHFNAFHCRFRDIARGGLRLVTPPNSDKYVQESSRQFDEAYGLSFAQQLKNKDIPEGGAKGVVLVNTPAMPAAAKFFAVRKSVRGFTDSLLDLIVKDSVKNLVDLYGKDELIYLGPDEQVIASDIEYIINRAGQRGYPIPAAFMSSKKDDGINHKEFGVTSEGVVVYLDVALRSVLKINPHKDPFTIKITGGPDGDVAGNLIKILFRDYGDNCKVVGIADGFGVAEDPNGLDREELMRLVTESLPITSFTKAKLSSEGIMMDVETEEGLARRYSMHFRVKSDAFVPAGGRPNTINGDNWREFLDADGKPSSPLIVEGANIFTTQEARENLFKHAGVAIVKDSSANKCGVITSSCEVACSMLLSKEEFMAIKKPLVDDVLVRLRLLARLEAELLFREYKNYPGALPHFSERISFAIGKVTDAVTDALADVQPSDPLFQSLLPLIRENLPDKLAEVAW